jgi:amino acid transporter
VNEAVRSHRLSQAISGTEFFALGFGTIIGVGWIIVLGAWLGQGGPLGAVLAFALGGLAMTVVGLCYAELATLLPVSGGELAYAYETFGVKACFATGWALALVYTSFTAFEAVSLGWVLGALLPGIEGPTLYVSRGEPVRLGSLLLGLAGMGVFTWLNYRGARSAARSGSRRSLSSPALWAAARPTSSRSSPGTTPSPGGAGFWPSSSRRRSGSAAST